MEWLTDNWQFVMVGFYALEKIVKLTKTPYDDMLVDMLLKPLFNSLKGKK